ncbi:MAG: FxLYD domain-containing protein, partial [Candidatus Moraniibacteriota bacterium]
GYQDRPAVNIYQKRYNEVSSSAVFGEAAGLVSNESSYDFRTVAVQVILRDRDGHPLALNSTVMNTLRSHENRDFRLPWSTSFPGVVENVEMVVDADVYHSDNFIQQYTPGQTFRGLTPTKGQ